MCLKPSLPKLEQVDRQIGEQLRELRLWRSLRRILQNKIRDDDVAARNREARMGGNDEQ